MLNWFVDPLAKKISQRGAKWRSELVRKRKAILGLGFVEPRRDLEEGRDRCGGETAAALRKRERSSRSSGREIGRGRGGRRWGMRRKRRGRESKRRRVGINGDEERDNIIDFFYFFFWGGKMSEKILGLGWLD